MKYNQMRSCTTHFVINIVDAAANSYDNPKLFELFQILFRQTDCVPHECAHGLIENFFVNLRGALCVTEGYGCNIF